MAHELLKPAHTTSAGSGDSPDQVLFPALLVTALLIFPPTSLNILTGLYILHLGGISQQLNGYIAGKVSSMTGYHLTGMLQQGLKWCHQRIAGINHVSPSIQQHIAADVRYVTVSGLQRIAAYWFIGCATGLPPAGSQVLHPSDVRPF